MVNTFNTTNRLNQKHYQECCGDDITLNQRGLDPSWVKANCYSADIKEASEMLYYQAKSPGLMIVGKNGQYQFKPDKPWGDKQGKKAPKYRTAKGDEYDALLVNHPEDPNFWNDLEKLKEHCYQINGHPYIVITEGAFKAIAAMMHGIPTVALLGVEMGLTPVYLDPQGKRYLVPALERLAKAGFGFILGFDADIARKGPVRLAMVKLAHQLLKFKVPVRVLPQWEEAEGKGIDDYIQMNGIEEFREKLIARAIKFEKWAAIKNTTSEELRQNSQKTNKSNKIPKADIVGSEIAEEYRSRWVFCDQYKNWMGYEVELPGVWEVISEDYLKAKVHEILKNRGIAGYSTNAYINNITGALKRELYLRKWKQQNSCELLPFKNGVLELATGKFHEHSPDFRLTWQLPREYNILSLDWSGIDRWLDEATNGNSKDKHLLLCFAAAVLRGRYDLQKFLYLIGHGGTGKSTYTNLLTALVGEENTVTLGITDLEDKHEVARLFTKRLIVMADQDKVGKRLSNFKRLTGGDRLSGRRLFENSFEFMFEGFAVVTSNFPIFHSNLGSWLIRRQLIVPFDRKCPEHKKRDLMREFTPQLSALTNHLLSIPIQEIENTLKGLNNSSSLTSPAWESLIRSDGLAAWVNDHLIHDLAFSTPIGNNSREWNEAEEYDPTLSTLYGSYSLYCRQTNRSAKSLQNFSAELIEQSKQILGWEIEKARITIGGKTVRVIKGLKLRTSLDQSPFVEEILENNSGPPPDNLTDNLTDNPPDNLKLSSDIPSDNHDNLIKNSPQIKNNFVGNCASSKIRITDQEVSQEGNKKLSGKINQAVSSGEMPAISGVEVVSEADEKVVSEVVSPVDSNKEVEDFERWPESDINSIAELILSMGDRAEFEEIFYPDGPDTPWIPAQQLNRAVKKLPVEEYKKIKAWVLAIKSEPGKEPAKTAETTETTEPAETTETTEPAETTETKETTESAETTEPVETETIVTHPEINDDPGCSTVETETVLIGAGSSDASSPDRLVHRVNGFKLIRLNKGCELKYEVRNSLDRIVGWIESDWDDFVAKSINGGKKTFSTLSSCCKFLAGSF